MKSRMSINKAELITKIADRTSLTQRAAERALNAAIAVITETCANGEPVQIRGFGVFERHTRPMRRGYNPKNNQSMQIPESSVPVFKPGNLLKNAVTSSKQV